MRPVGCIVYSTPFPLSSQPSLRIAESSLLVIFTISRKYFAVSFARFGRLRNASRIAHRALSFFECFESAVLASAHTSSSCFVRACSSACKAPITNPAAATRASTTHTTVAVDKVSVPSGSAGAGCSTSAEAGCGRRPTAYARMKRRQSAQPVVVGAD